MLTTLRKQTKFWMWIVAGSFILTIVFAWGMDYSGRSASTTIVGKINGEKIMIQQFQTALNQNYEIQRRQLGLQELDDSFVEFIQEQTWQQMVDQILITEELRRLGLRVSNEEILYVLHNRPPSFMREVPDFQTDGVFDMLKYEAAMRDPRYEAFWLSVENQMRLVLPQDKLEQLVRTIPLVTNSEAEESYRYRNERVTTQFVRIDPVTRPDTTITVSYEEIYAYYNEHQDEFAIPEQVDLNYVLVYKLPSPRDIQEMQEDIASVQARLQAGEDFATLARQYSDDTSAGGGGYLGWVSRGDMVSSFDAAAFELAEGEISEPIQTEYGWHIIECDSIRDAGTDMEQRSLSHILFKEEPSAATLDSLEGLFDELKLATEEEDFTTAAQKLGLEVHTTGPVTRGGFVPGIGFEKAATDFAFLNKIGTVSEMMEHSSAYYMLQVRDKIEASVSPIEEVQDQIKETLLYDKEMVLLEPVGQEISLRMRERPELFTSIAEAESLDVTDTGSFTRDDFVTGVSRDPEYIAAAFTTPLGEVSELIRGEDSWYILKVTEHTEITSEGLQTLIQSEKDRLLNLRIQNAFNDWIRGLRNRAKIVDNRSLFY